MDDLVKRALFLALAGSMVLAACSGGGETSQGESQGANPAPSTGDAVEPPAAPPTASDGPLTATADSGISVMLDWAPVDGAQGYDLEFSMGGGERLLLTSLDASATTYEDIGVPVGMALTYHLTPKDSSGLTYSVTVATPIEPPNPYKVEPVLEQPGMNIGGFDPTTMDLENFDPSMLDLSDFDPSMFEGITDENFDPSMLIQQAGTSATIGPEGGELVAEANSGARYVLTIPVGALDEATFIVMTPIESINGFPFSGGMTAAVQIEPSGIELAIPARLTIEAPDDQPAAAAEGGFVDVAYAFTQGGHNFHLTPFLADGEPSASLSGRAKLARLAHRPAAAGPLAEIAARQLDSYGVGKASPGEVGQFAKRHPPAGPGNRAAQKLAAGQVRVYPNDKDVPALEELGDDELAPIQDQTGKRIQLQAAAARSCKEILATFQDYQAYVGSGTDRQTSNQVNNQILNDLVTEARSILQAEKMKCLNPQACAQALAQILTAPQGQGQQNMAQAFAEKYPPQKDSILKDTEEMAKTCKLELVIESNMIIDTPYGGDGMLVTATVPLVWQFDPYVGSAGVGYLKGKGPVKYLDINMNGEGCTFTFSSRAEGSTRFFAHRLDVLFNSEDVPYDFQLNDWSIPGMPNDMKVKCKGGKPQNSQLGGGTCDAWCFHFTAAHSDSLTLTGWTMGEVGEGPGTIATRTYSRSIPVADGGTITERTVLTIRRVR